MTATITTTLDDAARQAAGNWRRFDSFAWFRQRQIADPENWAIFYTNHRESGLLDLSNAEVIRKAMTPFADTEDPDVVFESHSHWAVGNIDGFSVRIHREGAITEAFRTYFDLTEQMDAYPVLNEGDYSQREYDATLENIAGAAWRLKDEYNLAEGWEGDVFSWFWENNQSAVENVDDQGGYPSEADLREAFTDLGFVRTPNRSKG